MSDKKGRWKIEPMSAGGVKLSEWKFPRGGYTFGEDYQECGEFDDEEQARGHIEWRASGERARSRRSAAERAFKAANPPTYID